MSSTPGKANSVFDAIPEPVVGLCRRMREHGYRGWVVGGCVRDSLRGVPAKDWDVATDARPKQVQRIFKKVIPTGIKHGTVTVLLDGEGYEVTTLRGEGEYRDGRRPSEVVFLDDIEEDLARRDFTFNAIALDPLERTIIDPFGGQADLERGLLRAVGVALERFTEDGLRILRAARFAATMPAEVEAETLAAMGDPRARDTLAQVSVERVHDEWLKAMRAAQPSIAFALMQQTGVLTLHAPELAALDGPTWDRSLAALDASEGDGVLRLAALLHELAPEADAAADTAEALLRRLKFSNDDRQRIVHLVRQVRVDDLDMPAPALRRWLRGVTAERMADAAALLTALARGRGDDADAHQRFAARAQAELDAGAALTSKQLAIGGKDLITELGLKPGRHLGLLLDRLLERVLDDPALNDRDRLLALAREESA